MKILRDTKHSFIRSFLQRAPLLLSLACALLGGLACELQKESPKSLSQQTDANQLNWHQDLPTALKEAKNKQQLLMVDFVADWCTACQKYENETFQDEEVIKFIKENLVILKHDMTEISDNPDDLSVKYEITALPSIIFLNSEGKPLKKVQIRGFLEPKDFLEHLNQVMQLSEPAS